MFALPPPQSYTPRIHVQLYDTDERKQGTRNSCVSAERKNDQIYEVLLVCLSHE